VDEMGRVLVGVGHLMATVDRSSDRSGFTFERSAEKGFHHRRQPTLRDCQVGRPGSG
jgi:hypothetical protein